MTMKTHKGNVVLFMGGGQWARLDRPPESRREQIGLRDRICRICPAYFPLVHKKRGGTAKNNIS